MLLAAGGRRGQAAGESVAGPEPPSLDRCCKPDESEPEGRDKQQNISIFNMRENRTASLTRKQNYEMLIIDHLHRRHVTRVRNVCQS